VNSSLGENSSIIGSLAQMNSRNSGQERDSQKKNNPKAIFHLMIQQATKLFLDLLNKSRDPQS
jgi:hypothetical protein